MSTDQELCNKAQSAALDYERLYGRYPEKIGIERRRIAQMHTRSLCFPGMREPVSNYTITDLLAYVPPTTILVEVPFVPVVGKQVSPDEVYVPRLRKGKEQLVSGALLSRLARIVKRAREERIAYERMQWLYSQEYYGAFLGE